MRTAYSGRRALAQKPIHVTEILHHNTAIIPASQLQVIKEWQRKANQLPDGSMLLVLPAGNRRMDVEGRHIRFVRYRHGRPVTVMTVQ